MKDRFVGKVPELAAPYNSWKDFDAAKCPTVEEAIEAIRKFREAFPLVSKTAKEFFFPEQPRK